MSKDTPRLAGNLIMRKGEAAPSAPIPPASAAADTPTMRTASSPTPKGLAGTIAVTVRLDPARYERMKIHGARQRRTNQEILVAALDAYLIGRDEAAEAASRPADDGEA